MHYHCFAAPEYIKQHGIPQTPEDLDDHNIIIYGEKFRLPVERMNWLIEAGADPAKPRKPVLRVNNIYSMFRAVQSGLGIAALPDYFSLEAGNLVKVLPDLRGPEVTIYFVYAEELRHSKKVEVFRDFLIRELAQRRF
jgi:DNA-binding transcriptional LysR family regulator